MDNFKVCAEAAVDLKNKSKEIIKIWEDQVRKEVYPSRLTSSPTLIDHLPDMLINLGQAFEEAGTAKKLHYKININAAKEHGKQRAEKTEFVVSDILKEYSILRTVLFSELCGISIDKNLVYTLNRFIDEAISYAVMEFSKIQGKEIDYAYAEIERSNIQIQDFFMQAPVALVILEGPSHIFKLANPLYEKIFGRKVTGKRVIEAFTPEEVSEFLPILDNVYKSGKAYTGKEHQMILPDESGEMKRHWFNFGYYPILNSEKNVNGIMAVVQDVTEQIEGRLELEKIASELNEEKHKLETIFQESPAAMALWKGENLVFEKVNPLYQAISPERKMLGRPLREAFPEFEDQGFTKLLSHVQETGEPFEGHEILVKIVNPEDGTVTDRFYDFSYLQVRDASEKSYGVYVHAIDVTERVRARKALEDEKELRERFVAALSHDLRNPLTAAKVSAQLLQRKVDDAVQALKLTGRIVENMDRADNMIRDILDASRIKAGEKIHLDIKECELDKIISNTIENLSTIHGDRFKITSANNIKGFWDCSAVERIIENLSNNAVKYGSAGTPVSINVLLEDKRVEIAIHNEGNPISPEDQNVIFQPYKRLQSNSKGQKGWGIGLMLVKGFAAALGGKIAVSSSPEKGTTFSICLPLDSRNIT